MLHIFNMFGAAFTLVFILMAALWLIYLFQRNGSIADFGWGLSFIIITWTYFLLGRGDVLKMIVMSSMVTIWAVRLLIHLWLRYNPNGEDHRYKFIKEKWGGNSTNLLFLMLFVFQGVLAVLLSTPFFVVSLWSSSVWVSLEFWGIALWLIGVVGEYFADAQLAEFHKDPNNKGKVLQTGWWRFSRHPNYFFELIVWIGFALFALPSQMGWLALSAPIIMAMLILQVTGIPLAEAEALRTKGDAYREYQRNTSMIIPWFPKR